MVRPNAMTPTTTARAIAALALGALTCCGQPGPRFDGGPPPAPVDPFGCYGPGARWVDGDRASTGMHPGGACLGCHADAAPTVSLTSAGSVMSYWDEADDCAGEPGVTVEVTGADGVIQTAVTNGTGNFLFFDPIATPYTARVIDASGAARAMTGPQTDLDCNRCHQASGVDGAPGRVVPP